MSFFHMYFKIWRRRLRTRFLRFRWYKKRYALAKVGEITHRNIRRTADIEEELFLLGPDVCGTLRDVLDNEESGDYTKIVVMRILAAHESVDSLPAIEKFTKEGSALLQEHAGKSLQYLCRRLKVKNILPTEYESWVGSPNKANTASP